MGEWLITPDFLSRFQTEALLKDKTALKELSQQHNIPEEDILLIALNASGVSWNDIKNDRIRFPLLLANGHKYFLALTVTKYPLSHFVIENNNLYFDDQFIGRVPRIEFDTCTDSYWRKSKTHLTLNTNSRSKCRGCKFCGTYNMVEEDLPLKDEKDLQQLIEKLKRDLNGLDLSFVESIGIVTASFPSEKILVDHLLKVRKVFSQNGFTGELSYVGSQLRTAKSIQRIIETGRFSYYLTVEAFTRREDIMKRSKSSLSLEAGREVLALAKSMGSETSYLYIAGLDPLAVVKQEVGKYKEVITRFPNVQTYQIYQPHQIILRNPEASRIEYFLETRRIFEMAYPDLVPEGVLIIEVCGIPLLANGNYHY